MADATVHTFTKLGFRTMPIGQPSFRLTRDNKGKKQIVDYEGKHYTFSQAMPSNWTQEYGQQARSHPDTPLGGLICGCLTDKQPHEVEVVALDCDNQASWDLITSLHPDYLFKFASVGKPGGTILYELPEALRETSQFSLNNGAINLEYMAKRKSGINAMVYLPTTANQTKQAIQKGAELTQPPQTVINLVLSLEPKKPAIPQGFSSGFNPDLSLPFNAPLLAAYVDDIKSDTGIFTQISLTPVAEKVYKIFTPKQFREAKPYQDNGWIHPNDEAILTQGPFSEYLVGVSAIAGADPSVSPKLYTEFMQALNSQLDDPMEATRFLTEIIGPMVNQKSQINGKPIWRYNEKWDKKSLTIVNQYGETLEYFTLESGASRYLEYNHTTKELIELASVRVLRDQIYAKNTAPDASCPDTSIVRKLKLVRVQESVKFPLGLHTDSIGHTILNTAEASYPLQILRNPDIYPHMPDESNIHVQAFECFVSHLLNHDETAILFLKQVLAYHGRHLQSIPIILYMIGVGGAGKSLLAEMLETLFGSNVTSRPTTEQLSNRFNDYLEDTALLILSETSDSKPAVQLGIKGLLKTLTGENALDIETKGKPIKRNVPIFALPVLLANDPWYQEDTADRRLFSIMPKTTMLESESIAEFELLFGGKLTDCIRQGIRAGVISKYLSQFCPNVLPTVPLTRDKKELSLAQQDPIMVVKNIVATQSWYQLFDLMEEYSISTFFTFMESTISRDKNALFKNQLTELVQGLRGEDTFTLSDAEINKSFTTRWLPKLAVQYRPTNAILKKLGYVKWRVPIAKPYEDWKLEKLLEDTD